MYSRMMALLLLGLALPLAAQDWDDDWEDWGEASSPVWTLGGFLDLAGGGFTRSNPVEDSLSLADLRGQFSANRYLGDSFFNSRIELLGDAVDDSISLQLRELYLDHRVGDALSFRIGQQILTWGTGDFVFLNDFFPKDWQAMFSGRDDDYLKAPSASVKASYFTTLMAVDLVWTPLFTPDRHIDGERFSYFSPMAGEIVAAPPKMRTDTPSDNISNGQFYLRLYKTFAGIEYAAYGYRGFYTQPLGFDAANNRAIYPRLNSVGASLRSPWLGGIVNVEYAYWHSRDDNNGSDPLIPNSQSNLLLGFDRELVSNLTLGGQLMVQKMHDYRNAEQASPTPDWLVDEWHKLLTARLTWMAWQQKLVSSLFVFYSPDDKDYFIKPSISYRHSDHLLYVLGGNYFAGRNEYTQWGQFERNSNVYARLRYTF